MSIRNILDRDDIPQDARKEFSALYSDKMNETDLLKKKLNSTLQVNEDLRKNIHDLQSYISNLPVVTWKTDEEGITSLIGSNVETVYGYTPEEILHSEKNLWFGRIHPDDVEYVKKAYHALMRDETPFDVEYRIQRKDGNWIWLHDLGISIQEEDGKKYAYGAFSDITEKKEVEIQLQESEAKYQSYFRDAPYPIAEFDLSKIKKELDRMNIKNLEDIFDKNPAILKELAPKLKTLDANNSFLDLMGISHVKEFSIERTKGRKSVGEVELRFPIIKKGLIAFQKGERSVEDEIIMDSMDGRTIFGIWRAFLLPGFEHDYSKVLASFIDVTKIKEIERALKNSEAKFKRLFNDSPIPLREMDLSEVIKYVRQLTNSGVADIYEYFKSDPLEARKLVSLVKSTAINVAAMKFYKNVHTLDEYSTIRMSIWDARTEEENYRILKNYLLIILGEKTIIDHPVVTNIDGRNLYSLIRAMVVPSFEDTRSHVISADIDITELKYAEQDIRESEEKIRSILDNSVDGIVLIDEFGIILEWNQAMVNLTQIEFVEAIGKPFWETYRHLIPPHIKKDSERMFAHFNDVLKTGEAPWLRRPIDTEMAFVGEYKFVQYIAFPIKSETGFKLGLIWRDINHQKKFEMKLQQELMKFNIEDRSLYLIKESDPILSIEVFKDLVKIGYSGLVISRTPEKEYRTLLDGNYRFMWLAEAGIEEYSSSLFKQILVNLENLPLKSIVLLERLDFLINKFGFQETLKFIYQLREYAILLGIIILISLDETIIPQKHLLLLEKETNTVIPRIITEIPPNLLDILRYVYKCNNTGNRPTYTMVSNELRTSRVTTRKRIKLLLSRVYVRETQMGRTKRLELTIQGLNLFKQK